MNIERIVWPGYSLVAHDGTKTFAGALDKYFDLKNSAGNPIGISSNINEKTRKGYLSAYNKKIIKVTEQLYGPVKPIAEFTQLDFDLVISQISKDFDKIKKDSTKDNYRTLFMHVIRFAYKYGDIEDNWWWGERLSEANIRRKDNPTILKSLNPSEDLRIYRELTSDPETEKGEYLGLLLMQVLGLRNNEAAGVNFKDIREINHPRGKFHSIAITKTTKQGSNELQPSGKTWNAIRELPLMDNVYAFLMKRQAFLANKILAGEITSPKDVLELPIACRKNAYTTRCSANNLTTAGKELFRKVDIPANVLKELGEAIQDSPYPETKLDKDGTTYLFRRSFATHLRLMGMTVSMRKYVIGHDTENRLDTRISYHNEDKLYQIKQLIENHPICRLLKNDDSWAKRSMESLMDRYENINQSGRRYVHSGVHSSVEFNLKSRKNDAVIILSVDEQQASSTTRIEIDTKEKDIRMEVFKHESGRSSNRQVDTSLRTLEDYCSRFNRMRR